MGISFEENLKKAQAEALNKVMASTPAMPYVAAEPANMSLNVENADMYGIATADESDGLIAAYDGWMKPANSDFYDYYDEYHDDRVSIVDKDKNIVLADGQINLTQEKNSQYIPFEIPRYYDGFDLSNTELSVYWANEKDFGGVAVPVNVYYNSEKVSFGWLVDDDVTAIAGKLKFEIQASGTNSLGRDYLWKTKSSEALNVIQALEIKGFIEPDESWQESFIVKLSAKVSAAEAAASEAKSYSEQAKTSADEVKAIADSLNDGIETEVQEVVNTQVSGLINQRITEELFNYYLKTETYSRDEIDNIVNNIDISDQLAELEEQINNIDGLAAFGVEYLDGALIFYNGETVIKSIEIPTSDYLNELNNKIDQNATDISGLNEGLNTYKTEASGRFTVVEEDLKSIHDAIDDLPETLQTNYYTKEQTYSKEEVYNAGEIDEKLKNVKVDLTGYALESYVDAKTDALSSSINTNASGISSLSDVVKDLQETVNSVDTSPRLTYDIIYNNLEDENSGENVLVFYEIENEGKENEVRTPKQKYTITGGGGGTVSGNTLYIYYDKDDSGRNITQYAFTVENIKNKEAVIHYDFSGTDSVGDSVSYANAVWQLRKGSSGSWATIKTETVYPGTDIAFNVSEHIPSVGTYSLRLSVSDDANGYASKTWSIQQIDFKIESTFNDKFTYPVGAINFDYTPYGAISKVVHFILDGDKLGEVTTSTSGIQSGYEIPTQIHGAHLLEVYMTAEINGSPIESNHITKDIIWYDETSTVPVIGTVYQSFTARQYDSTNIEYTVYDPSTETPSIEIAVDGKVVSTPTLSSATNIYAFKTDIVGEHIITITCGETVKTLVANITKLDINIAPVTAGLVFDFNPSGKSNNDVDRVWSNGVVSMAVSDNFDWINGGYQFDSNGDQYFCIKAGTSAEINYQLFADDAKKNGKEMKLVFRTTNVAKPDATFLTCVDNTTDSDHVGVQMNVHEAFIYGQAGRLDLAYSEDDIIEFEFNISKNTEAIPMVMGYEDGVSTRPMVYDDSYNFTQNAPKIISLGSDDCDLHIYRFKVYNSSLTDKGILNNFIADARNAEEMISRYERNQIYDENQNLDPDVLAERCPWLRVYKLSAPYFTNNKSDKVPYTTIQQIYKDGDPILDNWTCYDCSHSGQGTSSNNYGAAGRNLDFIMNKSQIDGVKPYFILGDGTRTDKITLTRTSVPVAYLNAKVNIASSNNMTNAMLANRYNEFNPYNRPFIRSANLSDAYSDEEIAAMTEDEKTSALAELQAKVNSETSYIKDTMEFHNCVIFIQETGEDSSTHREFADSDWHFYAVGNIGDSKKTDKTRLTDSDDKYECCVEIMDVELPLSDFPVNTMYNAMGYKEDETTHERTYIWAKNENLGILYELVNGEYVLTEDTEVDLNKTYYVDILEHDDFSEDFTYGWRYLYEGDDEEENAEVFDYCKQKWIEFYRFVTTSTDEEFKAHIGDYVVLDSVLYYYLFTTRYCMVDNRAKNCFMHYGKTGEIDAEGNPVRKWDLSWGYDMDTSLGLNNYGKQVYRYGLEDTDIDEKGEEVFRESDSTFFCRIRDLFPTELRALYNTLESKNAWHAESFINKADEWQSEFPEELWRVDIERKYVRTYNGSFINGEGDAQFLTNMANGKMKYHRRQWERSQEKYMASKYQSSVASSDNSVFRCSVPSGDLVVKPNYRLKLTPYAYMYLNVKYGTQSPIQLRAEPNVTYEIPFDGDKADIVDIYSASLIQDFGDLSSCYVATADTSKASKVKKLIFGNETEGYDNPNFTTLTTGANYLLETLNIENVSGLTQSLNLSVLNNLRELYAQGSNIGGVTFADGGRIEIAELPAIGAINMKNLIYLTTLDISDFSKLTTLTVENCNTVDLRTILDKAKNVNRIRITGVDWVLNDTELLKRLYSMKGFDKDGYNTDQSVLAGKVHVPVIKQQQLHEYTTAWSDLEITFDTMIEQFAVSFVNDDGTVLEVQYVDKGEDAVDPATRAENPLIPTKESSISHNFTFAGWDSVLTDIFDERVITATYSSSLRTYTIKYVSKGVTMQESTGLYGENVPYVGSTPTYTLEESAYAYYLFKRWDKSGFIDGDKIVNAVFDKFEYTPTAFDGKELSDLKPVEIYAITKLGIADTIITDKDAYSFTIGNDIDYDDIESEVIVSSKTHFDGTNHLDTGIKLFDVDKDFVLAIDYEMLDGNNSSSILAQCFQANGSRGFKLGYNGTNVRFTWGTVNTNISSLNKREMVVIRHKAGDNNLMIYNSTLDYDDVSIATLELDKTSLGDSTLVFGCAKADDGFYENHAIGNINWCKVWYKDLGNSVCRDLALWTHEEISMEACGFRRYYLSNDSTKRSSFSLLATQLLGRTKQWNATNTTVGGWASSTLNASLNGRLYFAIPSQIRSLIKQVRVPGSAGNRSTEIIESNCYITIPSCIELNPSENAEPYVNEGTPISYMTSNELRKRANSDGVYMDYFTRSPSVAGTSTANYLCMVEENGSVYKYATPSTSAGVLILISI